MKKLAETIVGAVSALIVLAAFILSVGASQTLKAASVQKQAQAQFEQDALEAFREEREQVRDIERLQLNSISMDESADEDIRNEARRELIALSRYMEMEATLEGVLRARGFENAVVTVHANSVNVMIDRDEISRNDSAVILELAMRETGQTGGNVKIMAVGQRDE